MKKTILIVDDEQDILDLLSYNLSKEGYNIVTAYNGSDALLKINPNIDLILLDVMMPKINGYEVCESIKKNLTYSQIPIIFLTAKSSTDDEYEGLIRGAEDYIVKPISIKNLLLRIKNIFKQTIGKTNNTLNFSYISIDLDRLTVHSHNKKIKLTKIEFKLLSTLFKSPGKVFRRQELLNKVWGHDTIVTDRTVDVHIKKLRNKVETKGPIIQTSHGVGYYVDN